ncbi:MAG: hypothetical protein M3N41_09770 [Acidobacteriota bacterium]|nr:hypothetical protein [Acidobacteriota bacterium]
MTLRNLLALLALGVAGNSTAWAQGGTPDPAFSAVPFNRWLAEGDQTHFRWSAHVSGAELSGHQRLLTKVEIEVDGVELVNRRGHGQLVMMIQFQDGAERVYQVHGSIDLADVKDEAAKNNFMYAQEAFVLPGDYRLSMMIFDTKTGEHSAVQKPLHVNALRNDPLPRAWKDLPAVELLRAMEAPDVWFRPDTKGQLQLPLTTRRPLRVEVLMNASATGPIRGQSVGTSSSRSLATLLPALKVLSQVQVGGGGLHLTLLDIPKRHVIFEQDAAHPLDWERVREALTEADPNKIDVRALEHREQNAQFFVAQVRQRLAAGDGGGEKPFRVLLVLSGPTTFNSGEDLHPIEPTRDPNTKVYYLRLHVPPERLPLPPVFDTPATRSRRGFPASVAVPAALPTEPFDSLEPLMKPLQPRLFDIYSPEQFRKVLGSLLDEIGRL